MKKFLIGLNEKWLLNGLNEITHISRWLIGVVVLLFFSIHPFEWMKLNWIPKTIHSSHTPRSAIIQTKRDICQWMTLWEPTHDHFLLGTAKAGWMGMGPWDQPWDSVIEFFFIMKKVIKKETVAILSNFYFINITIYNI